MIEFAIILSAIAACVSSKSSSSKRSSPKSSPKVTIRVTKDERTVATGTGYSADQALQNLFDKLYNKVQSAAKPKTIQNSIDEMNTALRDAHHVSQQAINYCDAIIRASKERYNQLITAAYLQKQDRELMKQLNSLYQKVFKPSSLASLSKALLFAREEAPRLGAQLIAAEGIVAYASLIEKLETEDEGILNAYVDERFEALCSMAILPGKTVEDVYKEAQRLFRSLEKDADLMPEATKAHIRTLKEKAGVAA